MALIFSGIARAYDETSFKTSRMVSLTTNFNRAMSESLVDMSLIVKFQLISRQLRTS